MRNQYQDGLKLLLVAAGCVLLVACGNLANLMLARGLKDRGQTSVRVALGASRQRLVRKALVESLLLAVIGGLLGIGVAYAGTRLILHLAFQIGGSTNFIPVDPSPSWPVLLFTLAISVLTGVIFGIVPAWMTSHADPIEALRGANRSVGTSRSWMQRSLVIAQVAVSLVLLSAAALLGRSLRNLQHQNFGFETDGRYIAWINPMLTNYKPEQLEPMFEKIDDRLRQIPGVRMVAPALYAPMTGDNWGEGIRIQGRPEPGAKEDTNGSWSRVMPGFFETLGAKMALGRPITEQDTATTRKVAVINEAFAKKFFKDRNPIGEHFGIDKIQYASTYEIVGVAKDMRYMTYGYKEPIVPMFWVPEAQTVVYGEKAFDAGELWSHYPLQHRALGAGKSSRHRRSSAQGSGRNRSRPRPLWCRLLRDHPQRRFPAAEHDRNADEPLRRPRPAAGSGRTVRRDVLHGGAKDKRDRHSHGARSRSLACDQDGAARSLLAGRDWVGSRHPRSGRGRQADEGSTVRRKTVGPGHALAGNSTARTGSGVCVRNSGTPRRRSRANGRAPK